VRWPDTDEVNQLDAGLPAFTPIFHGIEGENRREFFPREWILLSDPAQFGDQYFGPGRHVDPGVLGDEGGRLSDHIRVDCAALIEHQPAQFILLLALDEITVAEFEFFSDDIFDG